MAELKQLTPIQELIEWVEENKTNGLTQIPTIHTENFLIKLLEKEKKIITDAHTDGYVTHTLEDKMGHKSGDIYYNQTFKNK